jgi:hypothetical protein
MRIVLQFENQENFVNEIEKQTSEKFDGEYLQKSNKHVIKYL